MLRRHQAPALLIASLLLPAAAQSAVLYREVFAARPNGSTIGQEANLYANGWYGGNSNDGFLVGQGGGEGGISNGAPGDTELAAVYSNPVGGVAPSSFAFFSKTGVSNNFLYTAEFSTSAASIQTIEWSSRNVIHDGNLAASGQGSAAQVAMRLVLQINGSWYLSDAALVQSGNDTAWRSNSLSMAALDWSLCTSGAAGKLPSCNPTGTFGDLPTGDVTAFGLWWVRGAGTYRIDNFTINGAATAVPEPGALALVGLALVGLVASRRRTGPQSH